MKISNITRQLSFEDIKPKKKIRYMQILDRLSEENKTAKEIAVELFNLGFIPSTERNYTAPRLTELEKMGYVEETAKKTCQYTGKAVTVYKITQKGYEAINYNHIPRID
nr:MAG TPA: PadR family transcriptional regulator factor [Caudoviricetes sp.]